MLNKRDELAAHIDRLCLAHTIRVIDRKGCGGWASRRTRTISIRAIKTERTYIIALHEIGHVIGRNRSGRRLEQEAAAWDFVLEQSIVTLAPGSYSFMLRCLDSYLQRATRRRMIVPEMGHRFWVTYHTILREVVADKERASA